MLTPSAKIYLSKSKISGRGVFAKSKIEKGEIIEIAPVIIIPFNEKHLLPLELARYVFKSGVSGHETSALAMGLGSFYNHSERPNAIYHLSVLKRIIEFIALEDIDPNVEITVDYGYALPDEYLRGY